MSGLDVSVAIVTYESARFLPSCLDAVAAQTLAPREVIVVDNASRDGSAALARCHAAAPRVEVNRDNRGFAAGQNQAIRASSGAWVLALNPDVVLAPTFLAELAARAEPRRAPVGGPLAAGDTPARADAEAPVPRLGTLCGKLLRLGEDLRPVAPPVVDSTGIVFTRQFRHLDRGSQEADRGQFEREELVFGASAAAALYRREMIEDVSVDGELFDEAFFAYREDADLAWRAQLLGWDCLYVPSAVGYHLRRVLPEGRRDVPAMLNRHSVKNRFLMRLKNADAAVWWRCGWRGVLRDAAVVGGCLAFEWRSLPALADLAALWPRARRQRRQIQARRRRGGGEIARWFT